MLHKEQFLPSITTTKEWKSKIEEIDKLGLEKIALFLTRLEDRKEIFSLLEKTTLKEIPFSHIRSDMKPEELDYLINRWNCQVFNLHPLSEFPLVYDYSKYVDKIYIENVYFSFKKEDIKGFAGVCLDFSHLEDDKKSRRKEFKRRIKIINKFKIGCNHISAVKEEPFIDEKGHSIFSCHFLNDFSELNYLKEYEDKYFSDYCAIELENSLEEQIKVIEYIVNQSKS